MKLRLRTFGPATAFFCELVGLTALALSPEVERVLFFAPLVFGVLAWLVRFSLPDRLLLFLIAVLVVGGYVTAGAEPTGTLVARALIPAHALLWLSADERIYRFWRLGVALVELVLAAILSPEAYMFVLIFAFVLVSSLALSLGFIERRFKARDPDSLERPLRGSFVGSVLALSCVIFLSSLLIFPLLPRARWSSGAGGDTSVGYNDVVGFQQGILKWARQDGRAALWIFRNGNRSWESIVPYYLLRGQALERFDVLDWRAVPGTRTQPTGQFKVDGTVEIRRQPLPTDILPVPYGTLAVQSASEYPVSQLGAGEWVAQGGRAKSVRYEAQIGAPRPGEYGTGPDGYNKSFSAQMFPGIAKLAEDLSRNASTPEEKISAVQRYFREGGFKYELRPVAGYKPGQPHPIEEFLLKSRSGHCELFASSAALLLRAMGLPARLTVGFRVRPPSRGDVLTVRASDAHAWVEVWTSGRGWRPLDVTPVIPESGWIGEAFSEASDWIGAYWTRYILEYEFDSDAILAQLPVVVGTGSALALVIGLLLWWRRRMSMNFGPRDRLSRVFLNFEDDLVHRAGMFPDQAYRDLPEAKEWKRRYAELRFGRNEPTNDDVGRMRRQASRIVVNASRESKSAG